MALKAYALTTVARFKIFAKITNADNDSIIETFINQITEFIEGYCNRRFMLTAHSGIKLDSDGGETLYLSNYPISTTATFTLYQRSSSENEDEWDTVDSKDYFIDYDSGLIYLVDGGSWVRGRQAFKVDYTAGYDFDNVTKFLSDTEAGDLEYACWKLVKTSLDRRLNETGITQESIADYSVTYRSTAMDSPEIKGILDGYASLTSSGGGFARFY